MEEKEIEKYNVQLSRVVFENEDFKIVNFTNLKDCKPMVVKGICPDLIRGMRYSIIVEPIIDPKYGKQFNLVSIRSSYDLTDKTEAKKFLSYFLTPFQIRALFSYEGDPIQLLKDKDINTLTKIKGISTFKANKLITAYEENKDNSKLYTKLYDYGISLKGAAKLLNTYKSPDLVIQKLTENPYILIDEVEGYGWKKTDAIALNMGIAPTSRFRLEAFVKYYLETCANKKGNTWVDLQELRNAFYEEIPEASDEQVRETLKILASPFGGTPVIQYYPETNRICLTKYKNLEKEIAQELKRLISAPNLAYDKTAVGKVKEELEKINGWEFTKEQMLATEVTLDNSVSIITGSAGTGKSTSIQLATTILNRGHSYSIAQTALSGRAASRMAEITGLQGFTIHRLIGLKSPTALPKFNREKPLAYDIIILDETSMVDGQIFLSLLRSIRTGAKLIMLGDIHQLEAIGLCNLLNDMIASGQIPYVKLEKIHRQAAKSGILSTASLVKDGKQIIPSIDYEGEMVLGELKDLNLVSLQGNKYTQEVILDNYKKLLKKGISKDDIDIIVPMRKKGEICLNTLNQKIQDIVANPNFNSITVRHEDDNNITIYENDKIIVTQNCYVGAFDKDDNPIPIFNGNIGKLIKIEDDHIILDIFTVGTVKLDKRYSSVLDLGYAITCHAKQGSEIPYAIVALDSTCYTLASREWLYTALTRAKKYCVLIGQNATLFKAIRTSSILKKQTWLAEILKE